jgi:hypothetical protein
MMARRRETEKVAQAWIELSSDDPEALSALAVARAHLAAGRRLRTLRRVRLMEVAGRLPGRERLEQLLHRSTQFYNPHKERCTVRLAATDPTPIAPGERAVLVVERDHSRRAAAERWWLHETGEAVEVREGLAWALAFEAGVDAAAATEDLTLVRGRRHGLLCNPHSQESRAAAEQIPVPWIAAPAPVRPLRRKSPPRSAR